MNIFTKFWNWVTGTVRQLWTVTWTNIKKDVRDYINNKNLQNLAYNVVSALVDSDMTGAEKRESAKAIIFEEAKRIGYILKDSVIYTLIELAYLLVKNKGSHDD